MSDSRISFSKDVASSIGLSEAVLLEVLKESGLKRQKSERITKSTFFLDRKRTNGIPEKPTKQRFSCRK